MLIKAKQRLMSKNSTGNIILHNLHFYQKCLLGFIMVSSSETLKTIIFNHILKNTFFLMNIMQKAYSILQIVVNPIIYINNIELWDKTLRPMTMSFVGISVPKIFIF